LCEGPVAVPEANRAATDYVQLMIIVQIRGEADGVVRKRQGHRSSEGSVSIPGQEENSTRGLWCFRVHIARFIGENEVKFIVAVKITHQRC
jgi:hypothetical protein